MLGVAALLGTASCSGNFVTEDAAFIVHAGFEESRLHFDKKGASGVPTLFSENDVLCANGQNSIACTIENGGKTASFSFGTSPGSSLRAVINPGTVKGFSGGKYTVALPSVQHYIQDSFDNEGALVCGTGTPEDLRLHHAGAYLKLTPQDNERNIQEVIVEASGQALCGRFLLDCGTLSASPAEGLQKLKLDCGENGVPCGNPLIIAIPAGVYSPLTVRFVDTRNRYMEVHKEIFNAERGVMYSSAFDFREDGTVVTAGTGTLLESDLFSRISDKPFMTADAESPAWRSASITSGRIVPPDKSPDGRWYWYVRGSSSSHQTIGLFTQEAEKFNPLGPWDEYAENPVIGTGEADSFDGWRVLGVCPVPMPDKSLYFYYKARAYNQGGTYGTGLARSTDGVRFEKLSSSSIASYNPSDVLYYGGKYYYFSGRRLWLLDEPAVIPGTPDYYYMKAGDGPGGFDKACLFGNRVFRLSGVDKWFMLYHGDPVHSDFPYRFHAAFSDDLIHWTKVQNTRPLFTRGAQGQWDQGAIWAPEIIEYGDSLYIYYEGWGREGYVENRDEAYFTPALSQTGVAVCDKEDFLRWCGL